jgi:hypothetical protein
MMFIVKKMTMIVALVLLLTAVACQGQTGTAANTAETASDSAVAASTAVVEEPAVVPTEAAAPAEETAMLPEVTFVGKDYAYEGPESISGGWTRVIFDNQDNVAHELAMVQLLEGKTMDDVMGILQSEDPPPSWAKIVGDANADGGQSASFISKLDPGSYVILSTNSGDEGGAPDFAQGMLRELTVTEATAEVPDSALPQPDATIELVDYQFVVDGLKSGPQLVRYSNDGTETHEAIMFRLQEGKTMDDFMAFMEADGEGIPPFDGEPSVTILSPGSVTYTTLDLDSGNYILVCFLPSESHDNTPHAMLGMVNEVTVD